MADAYRFGSFREATEKVLRHLRAEIDLDAWMIARVRSGTWVLVDVEDRVFGLERGDTIGWPDAGRLDRGSDNPQDLVRIIDGAVHHPRHARPRAQPVQRIVALPLVGRHGQVLGVLCGMDSEPPNGVAEGAYRLLELLAGLLGHLLENEIDRTSLARKNERFRYEAMTDALTHLPNRRAWEEKLQHEELRLAELGEPTFLTVIDLDSLKEVNDREGHHAGDRLLRESARVLREAVRDSDFVARVGGDEFAVLGLQSGAIDSTWISARFRKALKRAGISASVGTALAAPAQPLKRAWAEADRAMYREKRERAITSRQSATG